METRNDVSNFLNKYEVSFCPTMEDHENLIRVKEILTNLFQDDNFEKLERILINVKEIEILSGASDWREIPDVVKILPKGIKILQIQMYYLIIFVDNLIIKVFLLVVNCHILRKYIIT